VAIGASQGLGHRRPERIETSRSCDRPPASTRTRGEGIKATPGGGAGFGWWGAGCGVRGLRVRHAGCGAANSRVHSAGVWLVAPCRPIPGGAVRPVQMACRSCSHREVCSRYVALSGSDEHEATLTIRVRSCVIGIHACRVMVPDWSGTARRVSPRPDRTCRAPPVRPPGPKPGVGRLRGSGRWREAVGEPKAVATLAVREEGRSRNVGHPLRHRRGSIAVASIPAGG